MVALGMVVGDVVADFRLGFGHAREITTAESFGVEAAAGYGLPRSEDTTRPSVADVRPARGAGPRGPGPRACPRQRLRASSGRASWTGRARPPPWQVRDVAHPRPIRAVGAAWPCRVRPSQRLGATLPGHGRVRVGGTAAQTSGTTARRPAAASRGRIRPLPTAWSSACPPGANGRCRSGQKVDQISCEQLLTQPLPKQARAAAAGRSTHWPPRAVPALGVQGLELGVGRCTGRYPPGRRAKEDLIFYNIALLLGPLELGAQLRIAGHFSAACAGGRDEALSGRGPHPSHLGLLAVGSAEVRPDAPARPHHLYHLPFPK